jgi:large subunit ribosomal protein L32
VLPGEGGVLEGTQVNRYPEMQSLPLALFVCGAADQQATPFSKEMHVMAVPKRRMSRANTRSRRAQWKAEATGLVSVNVAGQQHKVPRRLLKAARLGLVDLDRRA